MVTPRATSANRLSQKSRRLCGSTALVGSSSSSSSGSCSVAAPSARRCRWPPLSVPARCRNSSLAGRIRSATAATRCRRRERVEAEHLRHELEVLAHGQVVPQRELLRHVAEARAQALRVPRHLVAEHLDGAGARLEQAAQHADRRRLAGAVGAEEAVDPRPRDVEVDAVDRGDVTEATRQVARGDGAGRPRPGRARGASWRVRAPGA